MHTIVDGAASITGFDHFVPNGFQRQRSEVADQLGVVKLPHESQRTSNIVLLGRPKRKRRRGPGASYIPTF